MAGGVEVELCFYGEITNPKGLAEATSTELQEQYEFRLPPTEDGKKRGRQRVRKTTIDNQARYVQTLKVPMPEEEGKIQGETEYDTEIGEDFWKAWRQTYCCPGVMKQRYVFLSQKVELQYKGQTFELPEVKFEIDVFINKEGQRSKWCKIDIEIQHLQEFIEQHAPRVKKFTSNISFAKLPIGLENVFPAIDMEKKSEIQAFWKAFERMSNEGLE